MEYQDWNGVLQGMEIVLNSIWILKLNFWGFLEFFWLELRVNPGVNRQNTSIMDGV
jgi:hypothetical protein